MPSATILSHQAHRVKNREINHRSLRPPSPSPKHRAQNTSTRRNNLNLGASSRRTSFKNPRLIILLFICLCGFGCTDKIATLKPDAGNEVTLPEKHLSFYGVVDFKGDGTPILEPSPFLSMKHLLKIEALSSGGGSSALLITLTETAGKINLTETTKRKDQRITLLYGDTVLSSPRIIEPTEQEIVTSGDAIDAALIKQIEQSLLDYQQTVTDK